MASEATEHPRWLLVTAVVVMVGFFVESFISDYYRSKDFAAHRYTVGHVTKTGYSVGPSSHSDVDFTYTVGDSTYQSSGTGDVPKGCSRCLVKFAVGNPGTCKLYNLVCVPDDFINPPPEGWQEPPFSVPGYVN